MTGRTSTPPRANDDGSTTVTVKRHCNGCGRELGDATRHELNLSVIGDTLPDVRDECGCVGSDALDLDLDAIDPRTATPGVVADLIAEARRLREARTYYRARANTHRVLRGQKQKQLDRALQARDAALATLAADEARSALTLADVSPEDVTA